MAEPKTITVVDVGSTKIVTLVGEASETEGGFSIIGVGMTPSQGVRRGQIINVAEATDAIRESLAGASASSGVKPAQVFMSSAAAISPRRTARARWRLAGATRA